MEVDLSPTQPIRGCECGDLCACRVARAGAARMSGAAKMLGHMMEFGFDDVPTPPRPRLAVARPETDEE